ncbi:hypothetical protein Vafri_13806 [Volvox africanus]|uniref:Uncharacterized protein n=1 Tax=Volvox africanus TaxID=51714 RepID=A0A8J4BHE2_9CHLO|nr:hypothetical protein Vafri_13806 [Volvox africanus]
MQQKQQLLLLLLLLLLQLLLLSLLLLLLELLLLLFLFLLLPLSCVVSDISGGLAGRHVKSGDIKTSPQQLHVQILRLRLCFFMAVALVLETEQLCLQLGARRCSNGCLMRLLPWMLL